MDTIDMEIVHALYTSLLLQVGSIDYCKLCVSLIPRPHGRHGSEASCM